MKIAVLADIHGNYPALKSLVEEIQKEHTIERWIVAGDISGHFPCINEVIDLLRDLGASCCLGNHDKSLVLEKNFGLTEVAFDSIQRQRKVISSKNLDFLKALPEQLLLTVGKSAVEVIHGGPKNFLQQRVHHIDSELVEYAKRKVLILGHSHKTFVHVSADSTIISPGSVGFPLLGFRYASGAVFDLDTKEITTVEAVYDKAELIQALINENYNDQYVTALKQNRWPDSYLNAPKKSNAVIIGASTYGRIIAEIVSNEGSKNILGFIDDTEEKQGTNFCGVPVLGKISSIEEIAEKYKVDSFFLALGDNDKRKHIFLKITDLGLEVASAIHPKAFVSSSATLGKGVIVDALGYIGPDTVVGKGVSVWPQAMVSHDCQLGDFSSVMPAAVMAGFSKVAPLTKVPTGSVHKAYSNITNQD